MGTGNSLFDSGGVCNVCDMCKADSALPVWFTALSEMAFETRYLEAYTGHGISLEVSHSSFHGSQYIALLLGGHSVLQVTVQGANAAGRRTKHSNGCWQLQRKPETHLPQGLPTGAGQCLLLGDIPVGTFVISEDSDQGRTRPLLIDDNLNSLQLGVYLAFQEQACLPMDLNQLPWAAF